MEETVTCKICDKRFRCVGDHIHVHNMTVQEYKAQFPGCPTVSEMAHQNLSSGIKEQWYSLTPAQQAERTRKVQKGKLKRKYFYVQPFWDKSEKPRKVKHRIKIVPFTPEERKLRNKLLAQMIVV